MLGIDRKMKLCKFWERNYFKKHKQYLLNEKADDDAMKSITGRSSHPKLDPDSSSLGPIDSAKEAKEKNRSWVKTIGIRTLRLRKEHKNKSSAQGIFSSSTGVGVAGQSTEESVIESVVEPRGGDNTGSDQQKHVKKSSSGASKTSNGTALREIPSSSSTTTIPGADSLNKADETSSPGFYLSSVLFVV
ncbi:unnamed protein product [Allacma fusca]|uniref:Uncharacterized protein n=1 Tax=Allacma fusca TaxID=39272 RepID=A0A8J2JPS7_9HEXA|nr:unnamed protein product [Allacma fusca]